MTYYEDRIEGSICIIRRTSWLAEEHVLQLCPTFSVKVFVI